MRTSFVAAPNFAALRVPPNIAAVWTAHQRSQKHSLVQPGVVVREPREVGRLPTGSFPKMQFAKKMPVRDGFEPAKIQNLQRVTAPSLQVLDEADRA